MAAGKPADRMLKNDALETELAVHAARGNSWAAEQLIRRYLDRAFATARRLCGGDDEQARDAVQDAFVKAMQKLDRFRGESSFYTWFYRILVNTCFDAQRRKRRWSRLFKFEKKTPRAEALPASLADSIADPSTSANPLDTLDYCNFRRELDRALKHLPDRQRAVFELKVFEEMKISEIAYVMNLENGTVKSHLFRAMKAVRSALADWAEM